MEVVTEEQLQLLTNEYYILHLLYHRSRNQHRNQVWFKYLNILHRRVRIVLKLAMDWRSDHMRNKEVIKEKLLSNIKYLVKRVMAKAYYEFNGIIALGQFINLGFTMLGNLSKLHGILIGFGGVSESLKLKLGSILVGTSHDSDDDIGEAIEFPEIPKSLKITEDIELVNGLQVKPINESKIMLNKSKIPKMSKMSKVSKIPNIPNIPIISTKNTQKLSENKSRKRKTKSTDNERLNYESESLNSLVSQPLDIFGGQNMDDIFGTSKKTKGNDINDIFGPSKKKKRKKRNEIADIFG